MLVLVAILSLGGRIALAQGGQQAKRDSLTSTISRGVSVVPETVTVGQPFRVVVRLRAPRGATLEFPEAPDSGTGVEPLDPVVVVPSSDTLVTEQTATYRLAAWDVGARAIRFPDVLVREGGDEKRIEVGRRLSVFVASVLPADSAQRIPKPPRALFEFGPPWWWWAVVALVALVVIGVVWWLWRRRRGGAAPDIRTPHDHALEEFDRVEALQLVASGEPSHHAALMTDVLRTYLSRVLPLAMPSLTTTELLQRLRGESRLPLARLARLLQLVDLVKFAGASLEVSRAQAAGADAREIVDAVDAVLQGAKTREAA